MVLSSSLVAWLFTLWSIDQYAASMCGVYGSNLYIAMEMDVNDASLQLGSRRKTMEARLLIESEHASFAVVNSAFEADRGGASPCRAMRNAGARVL